MARFQAVIEGTPQRLRLRDTGTSPATVLDMLLSDLHQPGGGGSGSLATLAIVSLTDVEQPFDSPNGVVMEMGFDLVVSLTAPGGGAAKEIGSLGIFGIALGNTIERLQTYLINDWETLVATTGRSYQYPNGTYSPLTVLRSSTVAYNVSLAAGWDVENYNHPMTILPGVFTGAGANCKFEGRNLTTGAPPPPPTWYTIPAGTTFVYRLMLRINDRTNTPIGPEPDAPTEWLYTLRGYQQFFRQRFGKPNYRSMGGWDGRPCYASYMSPGPDTPPTFRKFKPPADPTLTGGYNRVVDALIAPKTPPQASPLQQGFKRVIIWAASGWADGIHQENYAFKFMTGISTTGTPPMPQSAVDSLPAMFRVGRAGMRLGFWWGRSTGPPLAAEWNGSPAGAEQLDPSNPNHIAKAWAELDKAIANGATMIGLDLFAFDKPGDALRWARMLKARGPRVYFVTEQMLPDFLHVMFPTYIIERSAVGTGPDAYLGIPYHLANFLNPGSEIVLEMREPPIGSTLLERINEASASGYCPLGEYQLGQNAVVTVQTKDRWTELGERAVTANKIPLNSQSGWRSRNYRSRERI